jgi:hypothetical protein
VSAPWGKLTLRFTSCDRAIATYDGPDAHGANFKSLQRLTGHAGLDCSGGTDAVPNRFSGSWFDPERSGEGWILGQIDESLALAVWFTYGLDGEPLWLIGTGEIEGESIIIADLLEPVGGRFGPAFDPLEVDRRPWGSAEIRFDDCDSVHTQWTPANDGFEPGARDLVRLTALAGIDCGEP